MKSHLHKRIHDLSEAFHKGELELKEYRELRREELDALNDQSKPSVIANNNVLSGIVNKRVFSATLTAIGLIFLTVIVAKFVL